MPSAASAPPLRSPGGIARTGPSGRDGPFKTLRASHLHDLARLRGAVGGAPARADGAVSIVARDAVGARPRRGTGAAESR